MTNSEHLVLVVKPKHQNKRPICVCCQTLQTERQKEAVLTGLFHPTQNFCRLAFLNQSHQ